MEKSKPKVNAKRFIEDFRSGKSDDELMQHHGLNPKSLQKLLDVLVERKLLDRSELLAGHAFHAAVKKEKRDELPEPDFPPLPEPELPPPPPMKMGDKSSTCPQCGAAVSKRALTCPECGHVLPGPERWAGVETKPGFFDRIPPKLLGIILCLPIVVVMYYLYRDLILPASHVAADQKQAALRRELASGQSATRVAKQLVRKGAQNSVLAVAERLIAEGLLSSANENLSVFTSGPRWHQVSREEKELQLAEIRTAMVEGGADGEFEVIDPMGTLITRVSPHSIEHGPFDVVQDTTWQSGSAPPIRQERKEQPQDALRRAVQDKILLPPTADEIRRGP